MKKLYMTIINRIKKHSLVVVKFCYVKEQFLPVAEIGLLQDGEKKYVK